MKIWLLIICLWATLQRAMNSPIELVSDDDGEILVRSRRAFPLLIPFIAKVAAVKSKAIIAGKAGATVGKIAATVGKTAATVGKTAATAVKAITAKHVIAGSAAVVAVAEVKSAFG